MNAKEGAELAGSWAETLKQAVLGMQDGGAPVQDVAAIVSAIALSSIAKSLVELTRITESWPRNVR